MFRSTVLSGDSGAPAQNSLAELEGCRELAIALLVSYSSDLGRSACAGICKGTLSTFFLLSFPFKNTTQVPLWCFGSQLLTLYGCSRACWRLLCYFDTTFPRRPAVRNSLRDRLQWGYTIPELGGARGRIHSRRKWQSAVPHSLLCQGRSSLNVKEPC